MTEPYKWIDTGYRPRKHQEELHRVVKRFSCIVAHRRFGKGVWSANEIIDRALRNPLENPQYVHISPFISQAKRNMWGVFKKYCRNLPSVKFNENELKILIPRPLGDEIKIQLFGGDDPDAIRGQYFDGGIIDESAQVHPDVWREAVRPALSDRRGWCHFIGTPKGMNFFHDVYMAFRSKQLEGHPDYFSALFKASETGIISEAELADAKGMMSEEKFAQEYECDFTSANVGAYFGKEMKALELDGRIRVLPYDPALPVITGWDLGMGDMNVIWFVQVFGPEIRVIDYFEASGLGIKDYAKILSEKPYSYLEHLLPHDASVRELGTGKSRIEMFRAHGVKNTRIVTKLDLEDGIEAVRNILPRCYFDQTRCFKGIEALKAYQRLWDPERMVFQNKPYHNFASHPADSFRTLAVGLRENRVDPSKLKRVAEMDYDVLG